MLLFRIQSAVALFTCSCMLSATTISPSDIGIVMANGVVRVDGTTVQGNSTLFEGSIVQTGDVRSDIHLKDGTQVVINPSSQVKIYRGQSVLEKGVLQQRNSANRTVVANGLRVSAEGKNSVLMVGVKDSTQMEVSANGGEAEVRTASGDLVARIEPGKVLSFTSMADTARDSSTTQIQGILRKDAGGRYLLTDSPSNVTFQVQGKDLEEYLGASVGIDGTIVASLSSANEPRIIQATRVTDLNAYAAAGGQNTGGARPAGQGPLWTGGTIIFAIVVATGGVLLGLAAAGKLGNGPSVSRP
jgi:hypothetical protein